MHHHIKPLAAKRLLSSTLIVHKYFQVVSWTSSKLLKSNPCARLSGLQPIAAMTTTTSSNEWPKENGRPITQKQISSGPLAVAKLFVGLFSDFDTRRRDPPASTKTQHARLITIRGSHYCEKGRWALDLLEAQDDSPIYYTEDPHPPGLHAFATVPATKGKSSVTPCVLLDGKNEGDDVECIADSTVFLRRFLPNLYPKEIEDDIKAMEDLLGSKLGPSIRVFVYHTMLDPKYYEDIYAMNLPDTTAVEKFFFKAMLGVGIAPAMRKGMKINDSTAEVSERAIREVFAMVSERLKENGGKFIMDKSPSQSFGFTAADLTFAALASSVVNPPERSGFRMTKVSPEVAALEEELSETLAAKHCKRMYEQYRLTGDAKVVSIKCVSRDSYPPPFRR